MVISRYFFECLIISVVSGFEQFEHRESFLVQIENLFFALGFTKRPSLLEIFFSRSLVLAKECCRCNGPWSFIFEFSRLLLIVGSSDRCSCGEAELMDAAVTFSLFVLCMKRSIPAIGTQLDFNASILNLDSNLIWRWVKT